MNNNFYNGFPNPHRQFYGPRYPNPSPYGINYYPIRPYYNGPVFRPIGRVGWNVFTPSYPGLNHIGTIRHLRGGHGFGYNNYPGWGGMGRYPSLLEQAIRNPYKRNLLWPTSNYLMHGARQPVLNVYNTTFNNTYNHMHSGMNGGWNIPPHIQTWQAHQEQNPGFRYFAHGNVPSITEQMGFTRRPQPGDALPEFPFAASQPGLDPNTLNGMPRSTLQRMGDSLGSLIGRRAPGAPLAEPLAIRPGFPTLPAGRPATPSFLATERNTPFNGGPQGRERIESRSELAELRGEIRNFVRDNSPLLPATERTIGLLVASIDDAMRSPTLNRNHVTSARQFWQSVSELDFRTRADIQGLPLEDADAPPDQPAA